MKRLLLALLAPLALGSVRGALAELNVADHLIESPDGIFVGRDFTIANGFKLELLYIPPAAQGKWVAMSWDNKGRLIVPSYNTDQLMRITIPKVGSNDPVKVEPMTDTKVGAAEGVLYAFNSIYLNVNRSNTIRGGVYRLTDTNGDDRYDTTRVIRNRQGDASDHGTHDLKLSPDGKRIYWLSGNATRYTEYTSSRVVETWGEDNLVQRLITSAPGFNRAPDAHLMSFNEDGSSIEMFAIGMRNPVTLSFNKDGEIFLYDADHEPEFGFTSYRPTNVMHLISGADAGWRASSRVHPFYYFDNFGTIAIVGAGSPVGSVMGTGAKFPARFQDSYFISDWSFGNYYQVALNPNGASYQAEVLPFASGRPFAVSGAIINPADGSMILQTTGTELYRISYVGTEDTTPTKPDTRFAAMRDQRRALEAFHGKQDAKAVATAWPFLSDPDRAIRYAARTAIEWQDVGAWRDRALNEREPRKAIAAIAALARVSARDDYHVGPSGTDPKRDKALQARMLATLDRIEINNLQYQDKLDLLRAYQLVMIRLGRPDPATIDRLVARLEPLVPAKQRELNWEAAELLVYLQAPSAAQKVMALLRTAPTPPFYGIQEWINPQQRQRLDRGDVAGPNLGKTEAELAKQEDQLHYAELLRTLNAGWTPELRREFLTWFAEGTKTFTGGLGNLAVIKADAVWQIPEGERAQYQALIDQPLGTTAAAAAARGGVAGGPGGGFGGGGRGNVGTVGLAGGPGSLWTPGHRASVVTDIELTILTKYDESVDKELAAQAKAQADLLSASLTANATPASLQAAANALANAETALAQKRADGWGSLQTQLKVDSEQRRSLMLRAMTSRGGRGLGAGLGQVPGGGAAGGAPAGPAGRGN